MSNLYIKYRPVNFSDMVGNESAISALEKSLDKKNHSHVYLFTGPAGTGKTTAARIMASKLGAGELDIREVNSASNRGIDTARDILSQIRQLALSGNSIVYILDECHRWTVDFQNAMLKPLEDTPDHVYFFLCTTDPQKLIKPLITRCTEVKFELLQPSLLLKVLKRVNRLESLNITNDILLTIADKSNGCPRTALVLLERIASIESEEKQEEFLRNTSIDSEDTEIINLCRILLDDRNKWQSVVSILKELNANSKLEDPEKVRYAVLGYMNSVLLSGNLSDRAVAAIEAFSEPTYNTGKFGITLACLRVVL